MLSTSQLVIGEESGGCRRAHANVQIESMKDVHA
jgi:hypothetical protein